MADVAVIGLGDMGHTAASVLLDKGCDLVVWNRTPEKAEGLVARGATLAGSSAEAIGAAPVILFVISEHKDTRAHVEAAGPAIAGKTIVDLSTGDGPGATALAEAVTALEGEAMVGMMLCGPPGIGAEDTTFLMAGSEAGWEAAGDIIRKLAPQSERIGENVSMLADLFSALFVPRQGAMFGMIYGAYIAEQSGIPMQVYVDQLPNAFKVLELYKDTVAATIPNDDYSGAGSPVKIYDQAYRDGFAALQGRGLNLELPDLMHDLVKRGMADGLGDEHLTSLIKVLRKGADG